MPTESILDLLDQAQVLGFRGWVGFHHYSEPLLDKRNVDLARAAKDRGMQPYLHTNGDVLKHNKALCRKIAKLYRLVVVGLYDYDTDEELKEVKQYWRKTLPGANLEFSPIARSGNRSAYSVGIPRALVPSDARMGVPDLLFFNAPCHRPLIRLIIQHDGEVCNCCEDTHGAFSLGNVFRSSIEELWFSERHRRIVDDLVQGHREKFALCRRCPLPPTAPAPDGKRIDFAFRQPHPLM
jgi:radical SAM protein with 4Fe4S-binding SPASM domain